MRETRPSGSEGGGIEFNRFSLPLSSTVPLCKTKGRDPMTSKEVRARIEATGIVAAVRVYSADEALFAAEAIVAGGISVVEITLTVPQATEVIAHLVKKNPHIVVGAGGVMDTALA